MSLEKESSLRLLLADNEPSDTSFSRLTCITIYNQLSDQTLSQSLGMLVTHGFTQGPGQAIAMASIWENQFAIDNAVNFGLVYASVGFICAFIVGIPIARLALKKEMNQNKSARLDPNFIEGFYQSGERPKSGEQITHSSNVDSFVYHLGLLGFAYLVTDLILVKPSQILVTQNF